MKYYYKEHLTGYKEMIERGKQSWGELHGNPDDFDVCYFSMVNKEKM